MNKSNKFSPEVCERAVRMVQEHRGEYPSLWATVESIAPKIGCVPQTLHEWSPLRKPCDLSKATRRVGNSRLSCPHPSPSDRTFVLHAAPNSRRRAPSPEERFRVHTYTGPQSFGLNVNLLRLIAPRPSLVTAAVQVGGNRRICKHSSSTARRLADRRVDITQAAPVRHKVVSIHERKENKISSSNRIRRGIDGTDPDGLQGKRRSRRYRAIDRARSVDDSHAMADPECPEERGQDGRPVGTRDGDLPARRAAQRAVPA